MVQTKVIIFTIVFLAINSDFSLAAPVLDATKILSYQFQPNLGDGKYYFMYKTSDGSVREETGEMQDGKFVVKGLYSYQSDKQLITVTYEADEQGYRVVVPTANPDIPIRYAPPEPLDDAVICSLLGRCAVEGRAGNVNSEISI